MARLPSDELEHGRTCGSLQLREDLLGRLAERWGGLQRSCGRVTEPQRRSADRYPSPARVLDVLDHPALDQVLVGVDLTDRLDGRTWHTGGLQFPCQFGARPRPGERGDL